jgi:4-amino-4-deoxy-L-arabinose transferase-like glycosyltransferase
MFFVGGYILPIKWANFSPKMLTANIFIVGLLIRIVWVVFSYYFYLATNGAPFEFDYADTNMYHSVAKEVAELGFDKFNMILYGTDISDRGYIAYLAANYTIYGDSIIIARLIKAVFSAWTAVLVCKLASRTFGKDVGRMAGIFCMLMPEMIYWCGLHAKEVEMVFLVVLGIERADYAIRSVKLTFVTVVIPVVCAAILFTFRTILGAGILFAFITAIFFSSSRRSSAIVNRMILGVWISIAIVYIAGGKIMTEVEDMWNRRQTQQEQSMQWRANRTGGNKFAVYGNQAIFAPAIFVIPIASETNVPQRNLQLQHGGYFVKNLMAFFVMFALFLIVYDAIKKGSKWRDFLLVGSFMIGYLGVIALSGFAQSGRFHLPAMPFFLIFAAYGISQSTNKVKDYYTIYIVAMFVALVAWQWIKLAGRDVI